MRWYCISPLHSEDVLPVSRTLHKIGYTDSERIRRCLPHWEEESIQAVISEVERLVEQKTLLGATLFTSNPKVIFQQRDNLTQYDGLGRNSGQTNPPLMQIAF